MLPAGEFYVLVQERIEDGIHAVEKAARDEEAVAAQEIAQAQAAFDQEKSLVTIQQKEAGQSAAAACEKELDLRTRRAALQSLRDKGTATNAEIMTEEGKSREAERAVLQSQRNAANKREDAAKKLSELLGRRIEVLEAQAALIIVRG
ncbi:MAG: hypothetical protein FJY88_02175 [Candidatus Eisenbacteria bacterium]|nr:hypothetical protein [Candidatus Eisenbacteria bacterium]